MVISTGYLNFGNQLGHFLITVLPGRAYEAQTNYMYFYKNDKSKMLIDSTAILQDEFSHLVQEWNTQRMNALARAFNQMLYPLFEKELKLKLLEEAKYSVIKVRT